MSDESKTPLKEEILDKLAVLITAAFGLAAALAWNQAITAIFKDVFGNAETLGPMIVYALIVTAFAVFLTILVARAASKAKNIVHQEIFDCALCTFRSTVEPEFMEHMIKEHSASPDKFLMK
jgi:hypothetical protein